MLSLEIPADVLAQMVRQARAEAPIEACGILAGTPGRVTRLYEMTNTDRRGDHFMMDPREQFAVVKDIRARRLRMLAVLHSHPATPARPSPEDIRLALTPGLAYVILSLQQPEAPVVKGFHIQDGKITQIPVKITSEKT